MEKEIKLLLVEDDQPFRDAIKTILTGEGFVVDEASNGLMARECIKNTDYSAVISDIQMPEMNGVELVEWIRKTYDRSFKLKKELPIMLMTGFSHIMETQKAHDLGVQNFLSKPFKNGEFVDSVRSTLGLPSKNQKQEEPESEIIIKPEFCRVSLEDFVTDKEIEMDVYVKLSEKKHIKIAHQGGRIDLERVESYRQKGLKYLYVRQEDFRKVLDFNVMLSNIVTKSDAVDVAKKRRFVANTAEIILENVATVGIDEHAFEESKNFFLSSFDVLTEDPETMDLLKILSTHSDSLYAHSLGVSIYSVMIAKEMGWKSSANLFKLQFGALMHDIGKKEFPEELLNKPRTQLTYKERSMLETHAFRSKEILESLKSAPAEVVAIAYQHHENMLGQGYPRQLEKEKIHPMAKIVAVANEFCKYALKDPKNPGLSARKAFHLLETYKKDELDPEATAALKKLVSSGQVDKAPA